MSVFASLVIGREVFIILFQPEYSEHTDVFVWLMVAASMGYVSSILGYGMTAARHLRIQVPLNAVSTVIIMVSSLLLIPFYGLCGAALSICILFLLQLPLKALILHYALTKLQC